MEKKSIGFIGAGNMGQAIINGLIHSQKARAEQITVYDAYTPVVEKIQATYAGVQAAANEAELAAQANIVILAVKPNMIQDVLDKIKSNCAPDCLIVSIAAGVTLTQLAEALTPEAKIIRVMPNTPAMVGAGMSALAVNDRVTPEEQQQVLEIFQSFGEAEVVKENLIDAVVGVSGSAPAYVYMFIEALADGAVMAGMSRPSAYKFAAQTVLGSAKMVLETGMHPGQLKDMVTSPGGTTIEAVKSLENDGFRSAVMNAVLAAAEKNRIM